MRCEKRVVRQDEQRFPIRAAEYKIDRSLGHINLRNLSALWVVDENLAVGDVHIPCRIDGNALAASIGKGLQV